MQISLKVNTRDQEATVRSARLMGELGGIVAEPLPPTDEAAWVPLRDAGRASEVILGLRIDGWMLRQPLSLAWQLTRLQAATRKPLRLVIGVPGDVSDAADAMFQLKAVVDLIDRDETAVQPWLEPSRIRAAYWPVPRDPIIGAPPEIALYDADFNETLVMAAAQAADWYIAGSVSPRRLKAAAARLSEAVGDAHRPAGSVRLVPPRGCWWPRRPTSSRSAHALCSIRACQPWTCSAGRLGPIATGWPGRRARSSNA